MSLQIGEELLLLLMSMYGGLVLILCYDVIRIFRRMFEATVIRVIIEDVIFWSAASIFMFNILLEYNYGRPRYFSVGAALGVMALFEWLIGRHIVDKGSSVLKKIMNTLLKPLKKVLKVIKLKSRKVIGAIRKKVEKWHSKEEQCKENIGHINNTEDITKKTIKAGDRQEQKKESRVHRRRRRED